MWLPTFIDAGTDQTQDLSFWANTSGTLTSDNSVSYTGGRSLKMDTTGTATAAYVITPNGVMTDTGSRATTRFRINRAPNAEFSLFLLRQANLGGGNVLGIKLNTNSRLVLDPFGPPTVTGTRKIEPNTWYRISIAYTITNATTFRFDVYLDGQLELSATNTGTLSTITTSTWGINCGALAGANFTVHIDDVYTDNGNAYGDIGEVRVTAKRPLSNGTLSEFTTQIGSGGSGYGSGHAPQVNERPLSTTNGWSAVVTGTARSELYTVEGLTVGDANANAQLMGVCPWIYASSATAETGQLVHTSGQTAVSLTSTPTLFKAFGVVKPAGGNDVGLTTDTTSTTVSLYEAGVLIAWIDDTPSTTGFLDHFNANMLHARWTQATSGAGAIILDDHFVKLDTSAAGTDAAMFYYGTPLDKTTSQLWLFCLRQGPATTNFFTPIVIINKATAPAIVTDATTVGQTIAAAGISAATNDGWSLGYYDSSNVLQLWNSAGSTWQTADPAVPLATANDYVIFGLELDASGSNRRFRMFQAHQTVASGPSSDQGLRIYSMTDWVNWSSVRSHPDSLWLVVGDPVNDNGAVDTRIEWIRHANGPRQYAYTTAKALNADSTGIRTSWSYDGKCFVPKDRTTVDLAAVAQPWVVYDGISYHMFYHDLSTADIFRATASSPDGPWTYQNTVATSGANHSFEYPSVVHTPQEGAGRKWQMVVADGDSSGTLFYELRLFTADTPGGTWTDQGIVVAKGSAGADDETSATVPVVLWRNGQYEVWYTGLKTVSGITNVASTGMVARGTTLSSLAKDGSVARLPTQDVTELLDANLDGSTITISDTTGFAKDQLVYLDQDSTLDNWSGSRVRKVTTNTSVELYHRLMGYTTAGGAKVFGGNAGNQAIKDIVSVGGQWWVYTNTYTFTKLDSSIAAFQGEVSLLILPSGTDLTSLSNAHYSWIDSPVVLRGSWSNVRQNDSLSLVHPSTLFTGLSKVKFRHA